MEVRRRSRITEVTVVPAAAPRTRARRDLGSTAPHRPPASSPITTRPPIARPHELGKVRRRLRSAPGCGSPARVTGLTSVASSASCAPCQAGRWRRPQCTIMHRASLTGTSTFMSAILTLRATRAPPSRQTRATASRAEALAMLRHRTWHRLSGGPQAGGRCRQRHTRGEAQAP